MCATQITQLLMQHITLQCCHLVKTHVTLTLVFNMVLEVVKAHICAQFHQANCSSS